MFCLISIFILVLHTALCTHYKLYSTFLKIVFCIQPYMHITQQCDRWNLLDKDACTFFQPTVHISQCIGMHMKGVSHATHDVEEKRPLWCHITLLFCSYVFKEKTTYTQTWCRTIFTCPFFFSSNGTGLDVERNIQGYHTLRTHHYFSPPNVFILHLERP